MTKSENSGLPTKQLEGLDALLIGERFNKLTFLYASKIAKKLPYTSGKLLYIIIYFIFSLYYFYFNCITIKYIRLKKFFNWLPKINSCDPEITNFSSIFNCLDLDINISNNK